MPRPAWHVGPGPGVSGTTFPTCPALPPSLLPSMSRGSHCWSPDTLRSCVPHALGFLSNCFPKIPRLLQRTQRSLGCYSLPPLPMADTIPVHHLLGKARCRGPAPGPLGSGLDVSGCLAAARIPPVAPPAGGPGTALARSSTIYLSILSRGSCRVPCEPHAAAHKSPPLLYICTQSPRLTPRGLHGSPRHSFPTPPSLFPILSFEMPLFRVIYPAAQDCALRRFSSSPSPLG